MRWYHTWTEHCYPILLLVFIFDEIFSFVYLYLDTNYIWKMIALHYLEKLIKVEINLKKSMYIFWRKETIFYCWGGCWSWRICLWGGRGYVGNICTFLWMFMWTNCFKKLSVNEKVVKREGSIVKYLKIGGINFSVWKKNLTLTPMFLNLLLFMDSLGHS